MSTGRRRGGVLGVLLAPVRLPGQVLETLDSLAAAVREVGPIRSELTRVREQMESLGELVPTADHIAEQTDDLLPLARHISTQAEPLAGVLPALERVEERLRTRLDSLHELAAALASEDSHLNQGVRDLGRAVETRLDALHEVITALEDGESHLNRSVGDLAGQLTALHESVIGLQGDVERITARLPDPSRGPLEKARDVLTSGDAGSTG